MDSYKPQAHADEEESYFNESFESDVNINNVPTPFKSNKLHRSNTPSTNVASLPPPPSTQQQLQQHRRYRRHRSDIRGSKSSQQKRHHHHRFHPSLETELSLEAWQASQNLIGSLRSENHLLQSQLKECRIELRTVQRQCKVQSARLSKVVGREAEMPAVIDRLNAEVRAMQIRLRRKQEAVDLAERRALEAEARLLPLLEKRDHKSATVPSAASANEHEEIKKRTQAIDTLQTTLEEERRKFRDLQRKMELMERNHRTEQAAANEQIRKMRKFVSDLQAQLNIVNRSLQEKTKLLELQNIYSQRLPKSVLTQASGLEFQRERSRISGHFGLEGDSHDEALQRHYVNHHLPNSRSPPGGNNEVTEKRRRSRHTVCPISTMVAKMKNGLFTRSYTAVNNRHEGGGTVEGKDSSSTAGNLLSRGLKLVTDMGQNLPVPAARGRKKKGNGDGDAGEQTTTIRGVEDDADSDDAAMPDLQENFEKESRKFDLAEKSKISNAKETPKDSTADANLKELKEELERIVKRHEASTTKVEEAKTQLTELSNPEVAEASSSSRHEPSREELLWKSIFGKDGKNPIPESATSQYLPSSASAETGASKKKHVTIDLVGETTTNLQQTAGLAGNKSMRRQSSVWSALEDLETEKLQL
ncbi:Lebercilin [Echinococcus multilocularis]|uniref:Lebercilin n=1 Tax=Echinococcus multilocularis TaxID=6211 RepID=A0A068YJ50_ECHMU|nr:Lebercilin [Echinococcus multilocularis]